MKEKKRKIILTHKNLKGFSLMEMLIAIAIFSLIITVVIAVFVSVFNSRQKGRNIQQSMEDSRSAIELMAKNVRMSTIDSPSNGETSNLYIFNYSQNRCINYKFEDGSLKSRESNETSRAETADCTDPSVAYSAFQPMIKNGSLEEGKFYIIKSAVNLVGKVTFSMKVFGSPSAIQTTVSLRDYKE